LLKIYQDEIDILIELDSATLDVNCEIGSNQHHQFRSLGWLGCRTHLTTSLPILVLPESAQEYYTRNLAVARNYIAVDGLRWVLTLRDQLGDDAVVS